MRVRFPKHCLYFSLFFVCFSCLGTSQDNIVPADHKNIQYTGRINFLDPRSPSLSWPGTYIKANFSGSSLSLILDDQHGKNFFNVFIDNDWQNPIIIDCKKGEKTYAVASHLKDNEHSLTIFKRTEGHDGSTVFKGLVLDEGATLLSPPRRPKRRIEFFGDSITSGMGNEAPEIDADQDPSQKNNFLAYGAITARNLDSEYVCTSLSGIGIMASSFDFTMPDYYDQLDATGINGPKWDFNQWTPDVVVINLFQNDSRLVHKKLNPVPNDADRIQAYYDFLEVLRNKHPDAYIVCTLGSMDATKEGSEWPGHISKAVLKFRKDHKDNRIDTLFFEFTGFTKHPRVKHHKANAEKLTAFIKAKMGW